MYYILLHFTSKEESHLSTLYRSFNEKRYKKPTNENYCNEIASRCQACSETAFTRLPQLNSLYATVKWI